MVAFITTTAINLAPYGVRLAVYSFGSQSGKFKFNCLRGTDPVTCELKFNYDSAGFYMIFWTYNVSLFWSNIAS